MYPMALYMLHFIDDDNLDTAFEKEKRYILHKPVLVSTVEIVYSTGENYALEKRFGTRSFWCIDLNYRDMRAVPLYRWHIVRGKPVEECCLPGTGVTAKEKVALLAKRAVVACSLKLIIQLANIGCHNKQEIIEP